MKDSLQADFDALLKKYGELLVGKNDADTVEKIRVWGLYQHIHKTMPALTKHWNQEHPEAKVEMRKLFEEIKALNEQHRLDKDQQGET